MNGAVVVLALMLIASPVYAFSPAIQAVVGSTAASGCSGSPYYSATAYNSPDYNIDFGDANANYYGGVLYTDASARVVCKVTIKISKAAGDISAKTYTMTIHTTGGGISGHDFTALMGTSTGVSGSNAWNLTDVDFSFSTPVSLSAATEYAFVVDQGAADASNYARFWQDETSGTNVSAKWANDGTTTNHFPTAPAYIKIYAEE